MTSAIFQSVTVRSLGQRYDILRASLTAAHQSQRGAKMNVPMPEPQMATPVTMGLFLSKYCVMQSSLGR